MAGKQGNMLCTLRTGKYVYEFPLQEILSLIIKQNAPIKSFNNLWKQRYFELNNLESIAIENNWEMPNSMHGYIGSNQMVGGWVAVLSENIASSA